MNGIHFCIIGALEERALVVPSFITLRLADSSDHEAETKRRLVIFCRIESSNFKIHQDSQQHCATHHSYLLFNMLFIAILLLALLVVNQANAGVRISIILFSNISK